MSKEQLPPCGDFLLAAIRYLRPKRNDIHGVRLSALYKAASERYADDEIRAALNKCIKDRTLLIVARRIEWSGGVSSNATYMAFKRLSKKHPVQNSYWRFSADGTLAGAGDETRVSYSQIRVYIFADGLPLSVQERLSDKPSIKAPSLGQRILNTMSADRKRRK